MAYQMKNRKKDKICLIGKSTHCFLSGENKPMILRKKIPELDKKLRELCIGGGNKNEE